MEWMFHRHYNMMATQEQIFITMEPTNPQYPTGRNFNSRNDLHAVAAQNFHKWEIT